MAVRSKVLVAVDTLLPVTDKAAAALLDTTKFPPENAGIDDEDCPFAETLEDPALAVTNILVTPEFIVKSRAEVHTESRKPAPLPELSVPKTVVPEPELGVDSSKPLPVTKFDIVIAGRHGDEESA